MSIAPNGSMKIIYVEKEDKSETPTLTPQQFDTLGVTGLLVRMASGVQLHGTGKLGQFRPGDFNDHSFNVHVQVAYDRGWLCIPQFDLYCGSEFHMAGADYELKDNQFVPFAYQLKNKTFGTSYQGIALKIHDCGDSGSNVAGKVARFLEMIDLWTAKYFPQHIGKIPTYLRLSRAQWEKDGGHLAGVMRTRNHMPYILEGVTSQLSASTVIALPEPYEAEVWEPGNFANYKYERACFWHYTNILVPGIGKNMQALVGWGTPDRIFEVLGNIPVKYAGGGGGNPLPPDPLPSEIMTKLEELSDKFEQMTVMIDALTTIVDNIFIKVTDILNWTKKSFFERFKGE